VHEKLLAKESEMQPKIHSITGENTMGMVHNIQEQMNGEEVVYKRFWDVEIEEKRARDTWDEGDHPEKERPAFSPPTKILKCDKPLRHPAGEHEEKHEKCPQPEKMWNTLRDSVDIGVLSRRTLDAPVPGVTVRELLSISPDMIQQWFEVKRVPALKKKPLKKEPDARAYAVKWKEAMRKLYACASPKCKGRIEDIEFEMLIDSGAELCLMSREVFEELGMPIDLLIDWSVRSANLQTTKAYSICHNVAVVVEGITMRCRFFVLENLSQDVILGRPWERLVRAKHDNRDDGSCYTAIYNEHGNTATFCSVPTHHERNRAEAKFVTANPQ